MELEGSKFRDEINILSEQIIGASIEVHKNLGPGLLESVYEECLCHELGLRGIRFERQKELPVQYRGVYMNVGFRTDIIVDNKIIVEVKSVTSILPIHESQLLNYLRLTGLKLGLLINFDVPVLKEGITRRLNGFL